MASLNMNGTYKLEVETIDSQVTKTSPGNYALGKKDDKGTFLVGYVGRADKDVNGRLKSWVGKTRRPLFKYSYASSAKAAFEKEIRHEVFVPEHYSVMGAIGAGILAKENNERTGALTRFKGFDVAEKEFVPSSFECDGCSNRCEVIKIEIGGRMVAAIGDRCGKWTAMCVQEPWRNANV